MALAVDPSRWGLQVGYEGSGEIPRESPPASVAAVLEAMGASGGGRGASDSDPTGGGDGMLFVGPGRAVVDIDEQATLVTEDGAELAVGQRLPPDLPLGYHRLVAGDGRSRTVVVSPGRCPLPSQAMWGWAVQLYALRSRSSWGIGDLGDLRELARWSGHELGAGMVVVNPLHAVVPGVPQAASPYYPSSRRFRNPLYIRIEDVPGAREALGGDLGDLAALGRQLNGATGPDGDRRIDRDAVWRLKIDALERVWHDSRPATGADGPFPEWCGRQGASLESFAAFCVMVETLGRRWREWPAGYRHPEGAGVAAVVARSGDRVRFYEWLQWLLDVQVAGASQELAVVHDLAVGVDPDGADAWLWQDVFAPGMSVGAPPDEFNTRGQDWGVPPLDPWKLRAAGYRPFIETVRSSLAHAGGLRVDHVMGLFRLFWVPVGASPRDGVYVRYPAPDLLDILALESHRAGAFVVGEDLGTVEKGVREELAGRQVLSSRVLWSERGGPDAYPVRSMASVTTHDLPTVAGVWTGSDVEDQRRAGTEPNEEAAAALKGKVESMLGMEGDEPVGQVVDEAYAALARAPSVLLAVSVDDALTVTRRPNMPGTTDSWPNWSIPLPVPLEELEADPRPARLAASLSRPWLRETRTEEDDG